jgi:hypothetical protein
MSKSKMRGHFRYLRFKTLSTTSRTSQCKVFCALLLSSEHSGVSEDSKSSLFKVLGFTHTLGQSRVATSDVMSAQRSRDSFETISRLQLGSPEKKSHLDVPEMWRREYHMGEGGGFPRVRAVVSLVVQNAHGLSQHPKVFPNVN